MRNPTPANAPSCIGGMRVRQRPHIGADSICPAHGEPERSRPSKPHTAPDAPEDRHSSLDEAFNADLRATMAGDSARSRTNTDYRPPITSRCCKRERSDSGLHRTEHVVACRCSMSPCKSVRGEQPREACQRVARRLTVDERCRASRGDAAARDRGIPGIDLIRSLCCCTREDDYSGQTGPMTIVKIDVVLTQRHQTVPRGCVRARRRRDERFDHV